MTLARRTSRAVERPSATADGHIDRAVHGIFVGCVLCAPFWLAVLALTFSRWP